MLDGLRRYDRILAGAYSDRDGGVCPMLAAHRCGGRTDFRTFARSWDLFTGAAKRGRPATERELRTLEAQLTTSLMNEEHLRDVARSARADAEIAAKPRRPLTWLGPFRRWDRYRDTVERVSAELERVGVYDSSAEELRERTIGQVGASHHHHLGNYAARR